MVSGNTQTSWIASVLASVFVCACASTMPAQRHTNAADAIKTTQPGKASGEPATSLLKERAGKSKIDADADTSGMTAKQLNTASGPAPLPQQAYTTTGEKIAYVATPNPYTSDRSALPTDAKAAFLAADNLVKKGDLKTARERFQSMTKKFPALSGPWQKLGEISETQEKYKNAIAMYTKAIEVNRNNVNAYIALALVQRHHGLFKDAENTYIDALNVWKDFPEAHLNLAILYDLYENRPLDAQKHYEAFYFLKNKKDEKVRKWLVEVKRRTGIDESFIENPPKINEKVASNANKANMDSVSPAKPKKDSR